MILIVRTYIIIYYGVNIDQINIEKNLLFLIHKLQKWRISRQTIPHHPLQKDYFPTQSHHYHNSPPHWSSQRNVKKKRSWKNNQIDKKEWREWKKLNQSHHLRRRRHCTMGCLTHHWCRHWYRPCRVFHHTYRNGKWFFKMPGMGWITNIVLWRKNRQAKKENNLVVGGKVGMVWYLGYQTRYVWRWHYYTNSKQSWSRY